jgi:NADPH2:quinone reductase
MIGLQYARFGQPVDVVEPAEVEAPEPKTGEVRLRMVRSPIHNHDIATIRGVYGVKPPLPAIGGSEMLGVVEALGDGVTGIDIGSRVAAMVRNAWAQYAVSPAAALVPIPDAISDDIGAQLLAMPLSAVVLLDDLRVSAGDWIVQNAANGAVGRVLMRIAQKAGVNIVNLVRRQSAVDELTSLGATHVVVTDEPNWSDRVREIAHGAPIARVVDSICDAQSLHLNRLLGPGGQHVVFGALGGRALSVDPGALIFGETSIRGFWVYSWMPRATAEERAAAMARVFGLALAGELPLSVASVHPLSEAKQALAAAETSGRPGKVLFRG